MNKLSSYCGLFDAKIRASDKDLPVILGHFPINTISSQRSQCAKLRHSSSLYVDRLQAGTQKREVHQIV